MNNDVKITRATAKTLGEWMQVYERKTKEKVELPPGFALYYLPERGFTMFKVDVANSFLIIYHTCGDAKFWYDLGEVLCRQNGLKYMATICTRNVEAYIRFWNWKIIKQFNVNNQKRFICADSMGRKIVITFKGDNELTGIPVYWVTRYLYERAGDGDV